jgi:uncharacterized repeat protein (TIGR03843 family)
MSEPTRFELSVAQLRAVLIDGELTIEGRLVDASNTTLYASVSLGAISLTCVYKPIAGERPLWDFPEGTLAGREVGAYLVSEATGWDVVPLTVMRDGPLGPGMCQLWIDIDEDADVLALLHSDHPGLRRLAVFDAVVNNADRKGGHLLPTPGGHVYGVDHGVCFSAEDKLRTVLWQWRGTALPDDALDTLAALRTDLAGDLGTELRELLTAREVSATRRRVDRLLRERCFPQPGEGWPAVPWPPF